MILATSGRPLALAPLLPRSHARYLLLRGLPPEAELSAGRNSGIGTWFVKDAEIGDLSLSIGAAASGDYPLEIYVLESGDGAAGAAKPRAARRGRRRRHTRPDLDMSWATALLDVAFSRPCRRGARRPGAICRAA